MRLLEAQRRLENRMIDLQEEESRLREWLQALQRVQTIAAAWELAPQPLTPASAASGEAEPATFEDNPPQALQHRPEEEAAAPQPQAGVDCRALVYLRKDQSEESPRREEPQDHLADLRQALAQRRPSKISWKSCLSFITG